MKRLTRIIPVFISAALLLGGSADLRAQSPGGYVTLDYGSPQTLEDALNKPRIPGMPVQLEFPYKQPEEPYFEEVTFLKQAPPGTLSERVDRLTHGIYIYIQPEYDPYGHEIRRYMAHIGGQDVLNSSENIHGQLMNIKRAEIILKFWREAVNAEIKAIEKEIEDTNASSSVRTSFKYHSGVTKAFFAEAHSWMRNNRKLLEYLDNLDERSYEFAEPTMSFASYEQLTEYASFLKARDEALEQIQGYTPFIKMVY
ncbi:MAG: hypothetical protein H6861_01945 [Rhodospirillales bacterium]|nr:hypothetical protein [Rhodospirillales bacterium]